MSRPDPCAVAQQVIQTGEIPKSLQHPNWYQQWDANADEPTFAFLSDSQDSQAWLNQYVKTLAEETALSIAQAFPEQVPISLYRFTSAIHPLAPEYFTQGVLDFKENLQSKAPQWISEGELTPELQEMLSRNFEALDQQEASHFEALIETEDKQTQALKEAFSTLELDMKESELLIQLSKAHFGKAPDVEEPMTISILGNLKENLKNRRETNASSPSTPKPKV